MNEILILMIISLTITNIVTVHLAVREHRKRRARKESIDAQELLANLLSGPAVVKIQVINPADIFLRSPRHADR